MSSSKQKTGGWFYVDQFEGKTTRCYAGDDNQLLKLGEGALKVLRSKLTDWERCLLRDALEKAEKVKSSRGNRFARAFMREAV